ncbi:PVC-type heme-binding CxxCH protein [Thalassoglobus sp.]|uniref:PVC-type heme-binding CxxCH protein n=1 Tax=Thalassoglobus sp. TaxID=2795869 RepID=UPI003AA7B65C
MKRPAILVRALLSLACFCTLIQLSFAQEEKDSRDRFKENLAGNKEVERVIQSFQGKGVIGDDSAPTPADEAVKLFQLPDDLKIELVATEPEVMQPLFMHFDDRARLWVVQYLQYPFPEGLKVIRYDQYLRAVFDKVPQAPPNHVKGKDLITVYEDTNGDGKYDSSKNVIEGLNITSSVVTGHGGIWVINPPYLLFYPDADRDDIPDGDPEVRLSGFGLEDTHSIANSLRWGPDGWLYAANGSTTTGNVSSEVNKNVQWEGQNIWRYHPDTKVFEIYAEGGGNTFSSEIDGRGRVFSGTNHGNTRGMYYPQGSYGSKNWGKHGPLTNPFAFGYFEHMLHEGDKDRFPQTFVIYEGGTLPERYNGNVIAANALHNRVWASEVSRNGSTYRTVDMPNVAETEDRWFRPVDVKVGPDGAVYLADWYDTRLSHVDPRDNWHKGSGRVYRIQSKDAKPLTGKTDLTKLTDDELINHFSHTNKWWRQTSVRVLGDRLLAQDKTAREATVNKLKQMTSTSDPTALEALWTLHWAGEFDAELAAATLKNEDPDVRRWSVRFLGDHRQVTPELGAALAELATKESYVQVRSQLASTARRINTEYALPVLRALLKHTEDADDPHMPLLTWWAIEGHSGTSLMNNNQQIGVHLDPISKRTPREQLVSFLEDDEIWNEPIFESTVLPRLMQRFAMDQYAPGNAAEKLAGLQACEQLLKMAPNAEYRSKLMSGFLEAYQGRDIAKLPEGLRKEIESYQGSLGKSDLALGIRLGQADALKEALAVIRNEKEDNSKRIALIQIFGEVEQPSCVSTLLGLISSSRSSAIKNAAMLSLMNYSDPKIGQTICARYHSSLPDEHGLRSTAHRVLASRPEWTKRFLAEIEAFRIKPDTVSLDVIQQMQLHPDPEIQELVKKYWGSVRATPAEKQKEIARLLALLKEEGASGNVNQGRELFKKHCTTCHTLFDDGGKTGPNLTGYERDNLDFMLLAIVDPSAAIREEFTQFQLLTTDGRVLTGLLEEQTPTRVTLRGANNQVTVVSRDDIEILKAMTTSIMPDGLTQKMTKEEILDLFSYLTQPTPVTATKK